jgi:hypothetical protein
LTFYAELFKTGTPQGECFCGPTETAIDIRRLHFVDATHWARLPIAGVDISSLGKLRSYEDKNQHPSADLYSRAEFAPFAKAVRVTP